MAKPTGRGRGRAVDCCGRARRFAALQTKPAHKPLSSARTRKRKKGFILSLIYCGQEQWKKKKKEKDKKEIRMAGGEDDRYAADLLDSPPPRSRSSRRRSEDNSARDGTPVDVSDGRENGSHRYREVRTFKCKTKEFVVSESCTPMRNSFVLFSFS